MGSRSTITGSMEMLLDLPICRGFSLPGLPDFPFLHLLGHEELDRGVVDVPGEGIL